ncbi:MAG: isochorismatase family protein, partial [Stenotrophomonas sp.]
PRQIEHINALSAQVRALGLPVVWTYVAYLESGEDAGTWGTRTNTPDSLQNIKHGSERAQFDPRADVQAGDIVMHKRMASPFFETNLWSLLTFHKIDTLIITGGSTSGCVRACVIDSLSRGYRSIVPEECVADKHEIPHFANLSDIMLKYGDVESVDHVAAQLQALRA